MFSTFERELIAKQRQQELLTLARQARVTSDRETERQPSLFATLVTRLRGTANVARVVKPSTARA